MDWAQKKVTMDTKTKTAEIRLNMTVEKRERNIDVPNDGRGEIDL